MLEIAVWKLVIGLILAFIGGCVITLSIVATVELRGIEAKTKETMKNLKQVNRE